MEAPKKKSPIPYIICALLSAAGLVAYMLVLIGLHRQFSCFKVISPGRMIFYSLMVLLPTVVGVLMIVFYKRFGRKTKTVLFALLATSVVLSFVFLIAFSIMPPCASVTSDAGNYLVFDKDCPAYFITYGDMFPGQIPSGAENVRYFYRYRNYPDLNYDVFAQWTLPRSEYNSEKQRLVSLFPNAEVEEVGDYCIVFLSDEKKTTLDHIAFAFNDKTFTFRYMVSYIENVDVNELEPYYEELVW